MVSHNNEVLMIDGNAPVNREQLTTSVNVGSITLKHLKSKDVGK